MCLTGGSASSHTGALAPALLLASVGNTHRDTQTSSAYYVRVHTHMQARTHMHRRACTRTLRHLLMLRYARRGFANCWQRLNTIPQVVSQQNTSNNTALRVGAQKARLIQGLNFKAVFECPSSRLWCVSLEGGARRGVPCHSSST